MEFGERLRLLREESKLTRDDLAKNLNISYSTISKYETNIRFPDRETLIKMADLFEVSIDYLLGRSNIKETAEKLLEHSEEDVHIRSPHIKYGFEGDSLSSEAKEEIEKFKEFIQYKYSK